MRDVCRQATRRHRCRPDPVPAKQNLPVTRRREEGPYFILDFANDPKEIQAAFEQYYTEARIESTTDPNIVHQLAAKLAEAHIYTPDDVNAFARAWFTGAGHSALSAAIQGPKDRFAALYESAKVRDDRAEIERLEMFRGDTGAFVRLYDFMSQVIDYENTALEKLSVFLGQFSRVIETDRLTSAIDLSGISLKRIKHIDRGAADITLGKDSHMLKPVSAVGSGAGGKDPRMVALFRSSRGSTPCSPANSRRAASRDS